ncbi:MAG: serine/threonine-protein kinase [Acidobacteriota bacterium]
MTSDRFKRLETLFHRASEKQGHERDRYLEEACAGDPDLLLEVQQMLGFEERDESEQRLDRAIGAGLDQWSSPEMPSRIGPYRVLGRLGRGGLGTVFLAERDDEHFHKRVAIKCVRPELGSPELESRLRAERQILAGLDHPLIARILDGGAEKGASYIVMELVEGVGLLEHCRSRRLSLRDKLRLFRKVCDAVHYAHQNLVLHCDLKPSNILIDEKGLPKLLDFGIAKALRGAAGGDSATEADRSFRPLTPDYASPEQAENKALTTSSDIHSLGVILFELLCDRRPYRIRAEDPQDIAEKIQAAIVPAPSQSYRQAAAGSGKRRAPWGPDLDAVVAKAVHKEPGQRYRSVEQFSEDIQRYLEDRPVTARPATLLYRWRKTVRRHRWAVLAASIVALSLISATVVTSRQAEAAEKARRLAEAEKDRAEAVVELMVGIFRVSDPNLTQGSEITTREILDQGSRRIRHDLKDQPVLRAELATTLGRVYNELSSYEQAEVNLLDSLEIRRQELASDSPKIVESLLELALLYLGQDRVGEAEKLLSEALELESAARGQGSRAHSALLRALAMCRLEQSRTQEARLLLRQSLIPEPEPGDLADRAEAWDLLAQIAYSEGSYEEAERLGLRGLEGRRQALGEGHPKVAVSLNNVAAIRRAKGDLEGARQVLEETLEMRRRVYGDDHGAVVLSLKNLVTLHLAEGDLDAAEQRLELAASTARRIYGPEHKVLAEVLHSQAELQSKRGDGDKAVELQRRALAIHRLRLQPGHPTLVFGLVRLGDYFSHDDPRREAAYREAAETAKVYAANSSNPSPDPLAYPLERLGGVLCDRSPEEAVAFYQEAWDLRRQGPSPDHWSTPMARARLGRCLLRIDRSRGIEHLTRAARRLEALRGPEDRRTLGVLRWLREATSSGP